MLIDEAINREFFSLELLTKKGSERPIKTLTWLIQEFLALTLLPNRDVAKVLTAYGKMLGWAEQLPTPIYDQWIGRRSQAKNAFTAIATTAERKAMRKQILRLRGAAYKEIEQQLGLVPRDVEHISLRVLPVQVVKPQSRGQVRNQVLLVAYHMERCRIHFGLEEACATYAAGKAITAATLTQRRWTAFTDALRSRQVAEGGQGDAPIVLHAPAGSALKEMLTKSEKFYVVEDMPGHYKDEVVLRISHKTKHSISRPLPQVSFANLLRLPSIDKQLLNGEMTELPALEKLNHRQKDQLIATLWTTVKTLRQKASQSRPT